jgi:hypothetical protein
MRSVLSYGAHAFLCFSNLFKGELEMTLLTYAPVGNLPASVRLESAEAYLPWETFQLLLKMENKGDRELQVLADFVLALWLLVNDGGWRFDGDCVVKRKLPDLEVCVPPYYGHFVGSMDAHPCSRMSSQTKQTHVPVPRCVYALGTHSTQTDAH